MPEAEWGAIPREWVTVMRACRAQSDTSEPDLCSCRHRESMDEFFVRTAGGCADFFVRRFSSPGKRRPESCTTHVLSGQSAQIPLCGVLSTKRAPFGVGNRRRGIFSMQKHGKIRNVPFPCPCGATGNDAQNFMHRIFAFRGTMPMLKFYVQQRELAVSRRICCICGHCASMFAASRSCARQRSRFCVGRSILK